MNAVWIRPVRRLGRVLSPLLPALLAGCTYNGEVPELYYPYPLLTVQTPAVVEGDTLVLGRNQPLTLAGYYRIPTDYGPGTLTLYASENGGARRQVARLTNSGIQSNFSVGYTPATTVRTILAEVEVVDKYGQLDQYRRWVRPTGLTPPNMGILVTGGIPTTAKAGGSVGGKLLINSLSDPLAYLDVYRYSYTPEGRPRYDKLLSLDAATLQAGRQANGTSFIVQVPDIPVSADEAPGATLNLLLHLRTQRKLQTELYHTVTIQ